MASLTFSYAFHLARVTAAKNSRATVRDDRTGENFFWMWKHWKWFLASNGCTDLMFSVTSWFRNFLFVMCQERMKDKRVHLPYKSFFKLFLDLLETQESQEGTEIANPVTRILLMWTSKVALCAFYLLQKLLCNTHDKFIRERTCCQMMKQIMQMNTT